MVLTSSLLEHYGIPSEDVVFFKNVFPQGATFIDICQEKDIPDSIYHWFYAYGDLSQKDIEFYRTKFKIYNSSDIFFSDNVLDSESVAYSSFVRHCRNVNYSTEVNDSNIVYESHRVKNSYRVFSSKMIESGNFISDSRNVTNGINIINSTFVVDSDSVLNCNSTIKSSSIIDSKNIEDCCMLRDCADLKNCMFCDGLNNREYYIFNKPVSKTVYEMIVQQKKDYFFMFSFLLGNGSVDIQDDQSKWFSSTEVSIEWVKSLPNYSSNFMYRLTLFPNFLGIKN